MAAKSRKIERERVGAVVARGDAEIGFQQLSELLPIEGIEIVGPLPAEVQKVERVLRRRDRELAARDRRARTDTVSRVAERQRKRSRPRA